MKERTLPQTISELKSLLRINDKTRLVISILLSGGSGGGTGTYGVYQELQLRRRWINFTLDLGLESELTKF